MIATQFQQSQQDEYTDVLFKVAQYNYVQPLPSRPIATDGIPTIGRLAGEITDVALDDSGSSLIQFTALCHAVKKTPD